MFLNTGLLKFYRTGIGELNRLEHNEESEEEPAKEFRNGLKVDNIYLCTASHPCDFQSLLNIDKAQSYMRPNIFGTQPFPPDAANTQTFGTNKQFLALTLRFFFENLLAFDDNYVVFFFRQRKNSCLGFYFPLCK